MNKLLISSRKNKAPLRKSKNGKRSISNKPRNRPATRKRVPRGPMLSPCAAHYAKAIAEPWSPDAMGACIPKVPARPSRKVTAFTRQTAYCGTNGYGFIAVIPCAANDRVTLLITTPTFTGTSTNGVTSATVGVSSYNLTNLPVAAERFNQTSEAIGNPAAAARIVSAGISIQYTGPLINQGGYYRAFSDPEHNNLVGASTGAALNNSAETAYLPITAKKRNFAISAIDTSEYEYKTRGDIFDYYPLSNRQILSATDTVIGGAPFLLEFVSTASNPFFVEFIEHLEYVGSDFQASLTPSHADATGFETVAAAAALIPTIRKNSPDTPMAQLMDMALKATVDSLKPIVYKVATSGFKSLMI